MLNCILAYMSRCSSKANRRCCGGLAMIASNALYKIFTLYIPKAHEQIHVPDIVRQSPESPAASCRWSPDDPTMCSPSSDSRTDARRTPADLTLKFWPTSARTSSDFRTIAVRTSYDVCPMPRIPFTSSPMRPRCADTATFADVGTSYGRRLICDRGIREAPWN